MDIGPCRRMQRRTYPFASVILSPGSKIGHTPRKNPLLSVGHRKSGNLPHQRISPAVMNGCSSHTVRSHGVVYHTFPCVASVFSANLQIFLKKICVLPKEASGRPVFSPSCLPYPLPDGVFKQPYLYMGCCTLFYSFYNILTTRLRIVTILIYMCNFRRVFP